MQTRPLTSPAPRRRTLSAGLRARWLLFRAAEKLAERTRPLPRAQLPAAAAGAPPLWVFVATLGELNMIEPFLQRLRTEAGPHRLVLISDRAIYREAYLARHPDAIVVEIPGAGADYQELARRLPPALLLLAEIPLQPADAPCRLPMAALLAARCAGARLALVNGWCYRYRPASRLDALERRLFARDWLRQFDLITVHDDATRNEVLALGAPAERTVTAGNFKFDALERIAQSATRPRSPALIAALRQGPRPVVVAGCVEEAEQPQVLAAFGHLQRALPGALLVFAPRHPEHLARMNALRAGLDRAALRWRLHSSAPDAAPEAALECLVIDTFGELRELYAAAGVAHVGVDHNVLEPLAFDRPVTVSPGWEASYPSFPVYRAARAAGAISECADAQALAATWCAALQGRLTACGTGFIAAARGATDRNLALFRAHGLLPLTGASPGAVR